MFSRNRELLGDVRGRGREHRRCGGELIPGEDGFGRDFKGRHEAALGDGLYVVGVPLFKSCETAVTSCAGAKGLVKRMLFGTP